MQAKWHPFWMYTLSEWGAVVKLLLHYKCETTWMHLQVHCWKRGGGADFWNCRRLTSFFHAVVVRVVYDIAQAPGISNENFLIVIYWAIATTFYRPCMGGYPDTYRFCYCYRGYNYGTYRHSSILRLLIMVAAVYQERSLWLFHEWKRIVVKRIMLNWKLCGFNWAYTACALTDSWCEMLVSIPFS